MRLTLEDIEVHFYKEPNIIDRLSLDIDGDTLLLMQEGGGKSLLLRAICGLVQHSGLVFLDGCHLNLRDNLVSLVLEKPVLLEKKSVIKNINFTQNVIKKHEKQTKNDEILAKFDFFQYKYVKVKKLTLFQKRVLCLIRAYIKGSKILFLDDIFKELKKEEIDDLKKYLSFFKDVLKVYTSSSTRDYRDLGLEVKYIKYGRLHDMLNRDLFLAKDCGEVCATSVNKLSQCIDINLSTEDIELLRNEVINEDDICFEKKDGVCYVYDGQTGDLILTIILSNY